MRVVIEFVAFFTTCKRRSWFVLVVTLRDVVLLRNLWYSALFCSCYVWFGKGEKW